MIVDRNPRNPRAVFGGNGPRSWLPPGGSHQQSRQPRRRRALRPGRWIGPWPDAMKPDIHGVTHWNRDTSPGKVTPVPLRLPGA